MEKFSDVGTEKSPIRSYKYKKLMYLFSFDQKLRGVGGGLDG